MKYPEIYLAVDNCFASKRWTDPEDWMSVIKDAGLRYVEASADNECDPLYCDRNYLHDWFDKVRCTAERYDIMIANLYSGHGTYSTLGLAHPDSRNADRMLHQWLGSMLTAASALQCGLGFYCHAFKQSVLETPRVYATILNELYHRLALLAIRARELKIPAIGVEQMYTPHQVPWTIDSARKMLIEVKKRSGADFYLTIDTGHQSGQYKFYRPGIEAIRHAIESHRQTERFDGVWLGPERAYEMVRTGATPDEINSFLMDYSYLFAEKDDSNPYVWLEQLGAYSPIIHLQQTEGKRSAHLPFNQACNATGIIEGRKVLNALKKAYEQAHDPALPERCRKIYLTLEIFAGTAELPVDIIHKLNDSVSYWRNFIPEDGLQLDQL